MKFKIWYDSLPKAHPLKAFHWMSTSASAGAWGITEYITNRFASGLAILVLIAAIVFVYWNSFVSPHYMERLGYKPVDAEWPDDFEFPKQRGGEIDGDSSS